MRKTGARMRMAALGLSILFLAACEEGAGLPFLEPQDKDVAASETRSTKLVERDVEAPEVFQVTEAGLWDGRPSLGGVWVAHPDVKEPERVIIRNASNDKFVIGALFRRERDIPGPRIQASSDAAAALGMLAGAPVELNVTALRREEVQEEPVPEATDTETESLEKMPEVTETALDPVEGAAAAIEAAAPTPQPVAAPVAATTPKPSTSSPGKAYVQIGIFSVGENANRAADQIRAAGMVPTVREENTNGKPFWRVVVGPAQSKSELTTLLDQVKSTGFSDAYAVKK
nr:SPOR domain-containing protein [Ruegeria marina]